MGDALFLEEHIRWKSLNRRTNGRTPRYISQKWMKITTSVTECSERCWS
jgi:hypothetical protein